MAILTALHGRNSHGRLQEPGPDAEALDNMLRAALRAPDHGHLRPWRFVVIEGERRAALGEIFEQSLLLAQPHATDAERNKARQAPLRAPVIVAGLLHQVEHSKIPRVEQVASVAAALHGLQLAAEAQGFGAMWRTGGYARDPHVIAALGGRPSDEVIGFVYLGTRTGPSKPLPDVAVEDFVRHF